MWNYPAADNVVGNNSAREFFDDDAVRLFDTKNRATSGTVIAPLLT
jgi:hypothetical protein